MRSNCREIAPLLHRVADGEASPREAMLSARHVSDCTACRITLAREVRLASMLEEGLDDPLQVGEDFVQDVMRNLPQGPPPPPCRKAGKRRALKLACLAGLLGLIPLVGAAPRAGVASANGGWIWVPGLEAPAVDGLSDTALRLGGVLLVAVDRVGAVADLAADLPLPGSSIGLALACLGLLASLAMASVLAVAVRGARFVRSSGSG